MRNGSASALVRPAHGSAARCSTKQIEKKLQAIHTLLTRAMTGNIPCNESRLLDKAEELMNELRNTALLFAETAPVNKSKCHSGRAHRWKTGKIWVCIDCGKTGPEISTMYREWQKEKYHWRKQQNDRTEPRREKNQ